MAAGQGFKTFTTGEVLTAGDVNGYLMQGINVFTNATARDAAITAPAEGQFAFTKDNNSLWYYDGAAWVASGAAGDIEGVTAGVGISGGGTSGTVTITNSMATAITTAGDLIKGTGSGTFDRLGIGSTGQVLTVSGGAPTWASPAGGGKVLQVVFASYSTETSSSSETYADTGLTANITPSSTSNKILAIVNINGATTVATGTTNQGVKLRLLRASTELAVITTVSNRLPDQSVAVQGESVGFNWLDTPSSTSALTYKIQFARLAAAGTVQVQNSGTSTITLMEIGA